MTIRIKICLSLSIVAIMSGCAAIYNPIDPSKVRYPTVQVKDTSIVLQYKYDVLSASGNKKYFKKEAKFETNLVAIKITNNTDTVVNTKSLLFYSGDKLIALLSPKKTKKMLRQKGEFHLFYLLLSPVQVYSPTSVTPIGLVIGPGLTLLNIGIAASANKAFEKNLIKYSIKNKDIQPKTSIYGLAGIINYKGDPIYVGFKSNTPK